MDHNTVIQIVTMLIVGVASWVIRLLQAKIAHLEEKITNNSRDHYQESAKQASDIAVLFERTKEM